MLSIFFIEGRNRDYELIKTPIHLSDCY